MGQEGKVANLKAEYLRLYEELGNFSILRSYGIDIPTEDLIDPTVTKKASERVASGVGAPPSSHGPEISEANEGGDL